jgi:Zn-dependent protease with chaperone function
MDFFARQDRARKSTGKLVVLFTLAVLGVCGAMNVVAYFVLTVVAETKMPTSATPESELSDRTNSYGQRFYKDKQYLGGPPSQRWDVYLLTTLGTLLVIGAGSAYKTLTLAAGGPAVAQLLGGRLMNGNSPELSDQQRTLRNVVEEMSIASGVPMPQIYVLTDEPTINAFAAGWSQKDAVVGVTQGCLDHLTRDELQGVIAHEFSHILNGDMRLNIRLMGLIHGIMVIALIGWMILRNMGGGSSSRSSGGGKKDGGGVIAILIVAAGMLVIGGIGMFFGQLIQAAVSRQREYLADASAVQFTRNPSGIADALKKLILLTRPYSMNTAQAREAGHLFFGNVSKPSFLTGLLATHPPLEDRIKAIDPMWDGRVPREAAGAMRDVALAEPRFTGAGAIGSAAAAGFGGGSAIPNDPIPLEPAPTPPPIPSPPGTIRLDPKRLVELAANPRAKHVQYAGAVLGAVPPTLRFAMRDPFTARALVALLITPDDVAEATGQIAAVGQLDMPLATEMAKLRADVAAVPLDARLALLDLCLPALRQLTQSQADAFRAALRAAIAADDRVSPFEYAVFRIVTRTAGPQRAKQSARYASLKPLTDDAVRVLAAVARRADKETAQAFEAGVAALGMSQATLPDDVGDLQKLDASLDRLADATPGVKRRIIDAAAHTVAYDGQVTACEAELLRVVAAVLEVPIPPFVGIGAAEAVEV